MPWTWRVIKNSRGYYAEKGVKSKSPFIMADFIEYESVRFDTEKQAQKYVKAHAGAGDLIEAVTKG